MEGENFITLFAKFYKEYFSASSDSIKLLADIQKKYPEQYDSIKKFSTDPQAIESIINELSPEDQSVLLKILLKAGIFGRKIALIFDLSPDEKIKLAAEMEDFAESLGK